ncbi:MAG: VacB/RNase II family 3'-5' exoribonuclease, partial [Candidatus Cloacimonetes bacterium]|nr:VacB/RNase II family 3'-5' exoribonuclease [Candidatus Cloacimonadota bacterium]
TSLKKRLKQYITGRFDASSLARDKNFAFVIGDEFDVFISSEDILNAYHDDIVKVEVRQGKRNRQYGVIIKIVERSRKEVVGTVHQYNGKTFLDPDNSRIHTSIDIADIKQAVPGDKVVLSIKNWGSKEKYRLPIGDVKEILGKAGDPEVEVLSVIKHFNLPLEFPEQVMAAVSETSDIISEKEIGRRKDLRALNTITIDPASAKDFDDAVSFEKTADGFELFVHIADVAHYVPLDSPIFEEAFERGNSYYFPKRVIPMLPKRLSNDICSLRPREDKLTLTVYTKFDLDFNIVSNDIFQSVICSDRRFSYEEVDAYFAGEENDISSDIADILDNLLELSQFLSEKRRKNGYLHFDLPETEYVFDDEGHVIDLQRSKETDSHKLIENCMLIANEYTAKLLSNHRTLYRIHEKPTDAKLLQLSETMEKCNIKFELGKSINKSLQKLLERLSGENEHRVFDKMILRSMQKARYDTKNLGHFGLALKTYTHFT